MPRSVSSLAAFSMAGMSDLEPMTMPDLRGVDLQALEVGLELGLVCCGSVMRLCPGV